MIIIGFIGGVLLVVLIVKYFLSVSENKCEHSWSPWKTLNSGRYEKTGVRANEYYIEQQRECFRCGETELKTVDTTN